jgi:hypothetical protein
MDKSKINGFTDLYINGRGFRLEWEVEDELSASSRPYDGNDKKNDKDDKGLEDRMGGDKGSKKDGKDKGMKEDDKDGSIGSHQPECSNNYGKSHKVQGAVGVDVQEKVEEQQKASADGDGDSRSTSIEKKEETKVKEVRQQPLFLTYHDKVHIPEPTLSEDDDDSSPLDPVPVSMAYPPGVKPTPQWDGKSEWLMVAHSKKSQTQKMKFKDHVVAVRHSDRLSTKEDGRPIQARAEQRATRKNDLSGTSFSRSLNRYHAFNSIPNPILEEVAGDSNVVLGDSPFNCNQQINILKAKELAEAVLAAARDKLVRAEEEAKKELEKEKEQEKGEGESPAKWV